MRKKGLRHPVQGRRSQELLMCAQENLFRLALFKSGCKDREEVGRLFALSRTTPYAMGERDTNSHDAKLLPFSEWSSLEISPTYQPLPYYQIVYNNIRNMATFLRRKELF